MNQFVVVSLFLSLAAHAHDLKHLPLGDGHISTSPKTGWIWACHVDPQAGGAERNGPWIHGDGTYDFTTKAVVSGSVKWPWKFEISREGAKRIFSANDLPNHATGTFPVSPADEAWKYDKNPNSIHEQSMRIEIPADPTLAAAPSCAPGALGFLLSGAVLFNSLDAPGRDAVAHETQDACQGHPQESGVYHYHSLSTCVKDESDGTGHSKLVGYALDGFGIFGRRGEGGKELASKDLDECHGHTHEIDWDGKRVKMYHYHATWDFPYTVGCLRGAYDRESVRVISGPPPRGRGRDGEPGKGPSQFPPGMGHGPQPDLGPVAAKLGISVEQLRTAIGPPPPDLEAAARRLGISVEQLREALPPPPRR